MCGSDTFTTVVSSTSMKVANITAIAMIQGLISGCAPGTPLPFGADSVFDLAVMPRPVYLVITVGTTDIPGRSR